MQVIAQLSVVFECNLILFIAILSLRAMLATRLTEEAVSIILSILYKHEAKRPLDRIGLAIDIMHTLIVISPYPHLVVLLVLLRGSYPFTLS